MLNKLSDVLSNIKPVSVSAGEDEFWCERKIQATVLDMNEEPMPLHKQIIKTLMLEQFSMNRNTTKMVIVLMPLCRKLHRLNKGDNVLIDEVTIVDMFPNQDITRRKKYSRLSS